MAPPDGSRAQRLPTLSWDSVVDDTDGTGDARLTDDAGESVAPPEPTESAASAETPEPVEPAEPVTPADPVGLLPLSLDLAAPVTTPAVPTAPAATAPAPSAPAPSAPAPASMATPDAAPPVPTATPAAAPEVRTAPPTAIVPVVGDVPAGPALLAASPGVDALPPIKEATPPPLAAEPTSEPISQPSGPSLPSVAAAVQRPAAASNFEFDAASVAGPPTRQPVRRKRGGGLKLLVTLVVLGGLVAAGVVLGQPYLFPSEWDDATAPYAEAVESASGVGFVEPLTITALPSAEFSARLAAELAPTTPQQVAEWRALGLATGAVDDVTIAQQLAGWRNVVYATDDGQVYHDAGTAVSPSLEAELVQAMAAASLDQQYSWSRDRDQRPVDDHVATSAEVLDQVRAIQRSSDFAGATAPVPTAQLAGLPAIVGYQLLAPHVFAEFPADTPDDPNPLAVLSSSGQTPQGGAASVPPSLPELADGDVMTASPVVQDRSFWFLVFAGLLDGPTAYAASEAIVENSLVHATRGTTDCVYATFSGGGVDETATLRSALGRWSELAPPEFASSVATLPNGSLQLSSCDPGAAFAAPLRTTAVDELVGYRTLELATAEAVAERGGGDPEFSYVWTLITSSTMPNDVATLAAGSPPGQIATVSRDAVAALYDLAG